MSDHPSALHTSFPAGSRQVAPEHQALCERILTAARALEAALEEARQAESAAFQGLPGPHVRDLVDHSQRSFGLRLAHIDLVRCIDGVVRGLI